MQNYYMFVGQANRDIPYVRQVSGCGISVYTFNPETARVEFITESNQSDNPTYLTYSTQNNALYVTNEVIQWPEGAITCYSFAPKQQTLRYVKKQLISGTMTAYVALDSQDKNILVANYGHAEDADYSGGSVAAVPCDGSHLQTMTGQVSFAGGGIDAERQGGSHPHCIISSADNHFVIIADLGLDVLSVHHFNAATGEISSSAVSQYRTVAGAGPRQVIRNARGDRLYLLNELDGTASALSFDRETGEILPINTLSTMPDNLEIVPLSADIQIHPNEKFIYVSNRITNTLSTLSVDAATGAIALIDCIPSGGETPRSICVDPTGAFLVVANQDSDNLQSFAINAETGALALIGEPLSVGSPTCVKICPVTTTED